MVKDFFAALFTSIILACVFILAGFYSGIGGDFALLFSSLCYIVVLMFLLKSSSKWLCIAKTTITFFLMIALFYCSIRFRWFYYLFKNRHPDYGAPNAGTGFTVLTSYVINLLIFIVIAVLNIAKASKKDTT